MNISIVAITSRRALAVRLREWGFAYGSGREKKIESYIRYPENRISIAIGLSNPSPLLPWKSNPGVYVLRNSTESAAFGRFCISSPGGSTERLYEFRSVLFRSTNVSVPSYELVLRKFSKYIHIALVDLVLYIYIMKSMSYLSVCPSRGFFSYFPIAESVEILHRVIRASKNDLNLDKI